MAKKEKEILRYPVEDINTQQPESPIIVTQGGQTEQGSRSSGYSSSEGSSNTKSSSTSTQKTTYTGADPVFVSQPTMDAKNDTVLKSLGRQRQERLASLKSSLQSSAERENRKLKYNAWSNFLTSLGNIAGLGNVAPIQVDNSRTLESFKRMQDIYDAADSIENDPTLTWLDKERLNRQAVIDAYNLQAQAQDAALQNQWRIQKAKTGFETTSTSNNESSNSQKQRSSTSSNTYGKSTTKQGMTPEAVAIETAKTARKNEPFAVFGATAGFKSQSQAVADKPRTTQIVADILVNGKNGYSGILKDKNGNPLDISKIYNQLTANDIEGIIINATGNVEASDNDIRRVAQKIEALDKNGYYANWLLEQPIEPSADSGYDNIDDWLNNNGGTMIK